MGQFCVVAYRNMNDPIQASGKARFETNLTLDAAKVSGLLSSGRITVAINYTDYGIAFVIGFLHVVVSTSQVVS